ncbi:Exonuclease 3'-5' domain-containing protein 2 [Mortierella sp. AD031]|nr:Exonuclease 3'-5' domain-containing protein 2 [Mortierella sp. AD031]
MINCTLKQASIIIPVVPRRPPPSHPSLLSRPSLSTLLVSLPHPPPSAKKTSKKALINANKLKAKPKAKIASKSNNSSSIKPDPIQPAFSKPPPPPTEIVTIKSKDPVPLPTPKRFKVKNNKDSKRATAAKKQHQFALAKKMYGKQDLKNFDDGSLMRPNETLSESVQILCEAFAEANIRRVRQYPPVFLIGSYEEAELAMQIFTEYYQLTTSGLGPVGFDTETACNWANPQAQTREVSIIQMATQDICMIFQINRIVSARQTPQPFPPRFKAFLEDSEQLKLGVGAKRDAKDLDRIFGLHCKGLVDLEAMALAKNILERSLQDLDEMYGRPGREVVKTPAMLRWDWNARELQPHWVWYAAKDAFAGIAIYENMMADRVKDTYKPYGERFPMTETELENDIMTFLERAMGGKGRQTTLGSVENTVLKGYSRFQRMYQPGERYAEVRRVVCELIRNGRLARFSTTPLEEANKDDVLAIAGERLERVLKTQEAINILRPYFKNIQLRPEDLNTKGITLPRSFDDTAPVGGQDFEDLRLFIELGSMWQQPRKMNGMTSSFLIELEAAGYQGLPPQEKADPSHTLPEKKIVALNNERAKTNNIATKWRTFIYRLTNRGILVTDGGLYAMEPELENRCREAAPELPKEVVDFAETKRLKAQRRTAALEARLSTVKDLIAGEEQGPGADKRVVLGTEAEAEQQHAQDEDEDMATAVAM